MFYSHSFVYDTGQLQVVYIYQVQGSKAILFPLQALEGSVSPECDAFETLQYVPRLLSVTLLKRCSVSEWSITLAI